MSRHYNRGLETALKILEQAGLNRIVYQYRLTDKTGKSYRTILRAIHQLEKSQLIRLVGKEPSEKRGKERNLLGITLRGLLILLTLDDAIWEQIDLIASSHEDKLLVFKKWSFFEEEGVQVNIIKSFKEAVSRTGLLQFLGVDLFSVRTKWTEEILRLYLDSRILGCDIVETGGILDAETMRDDYNKIIPVCMKDRELSSFIENQITNRKRFAESLITSADNILNSLKS